MPAQLLESNHKKIGVLDMIPEAIDQINNLRYKDFIKILFIPQGYSITVDFKKFTTQTLSLFFINSNQFFQINHAVAGGTMLFYNRDFYCVQIHDDEVACDGLLFNNIFETPMVEIPENIQPVVSSIIDNIQEEFAELRSSREEMIRTYLKQIIIKSTRLWKHQQMEQNTQTGDMEFYRNFSRLVEIHFRDKHGMLDYAEILVLTPKTLNKKLARLGIRNPNDIIKDRIVLEAKRLLTYSSMSIKEIAYHLGYDDPAYFNRLFSNKAKITPASFRKQFKAEEL